METIPPVRPSLALLQSNPNAKGLMVGDQKALALVERQPQFQIVGDGRPSERTLVPITGAARKLMAGPDGPRIEEILRGSLSSLDARKGVELNGISLSSGKDGAALNTLMTEMDLGEIHLAQRASNHSRQALRDAVQDHRGFSDEYLGVYYNEPAGWITLAPGISKQLVNAADGRTGRARATQFSQYVLAHELEHAVTPDDHYGSKTHWIEEGTAEVMSLQQRAADQRADAAGFPRLPIDAERRNSWLGSYSPYYHNLVNLLRFGGIEPGQASGFERTREILQGGATSRVPGKLAAAIVEEQGIAKRHYDTVREAIANLGDEGSANDVRKLVRSLADG